MRAQNSYGSVELVCAKKDKTKRRKPYRVRFVVGWVFDYETLTAKPTRKTIGYARTQAEGRMIRDKYHNNLFDTDMRNVCFEYLFGMFYEYKSKKIKAYEKYISYKKFYTELDKIPFNNITTEDLQRIIDEKMNHLSPEYQKKVISLYHEMWEFAKAKNIEVGADVSKLVIKKKNIQSTKHKPFTEEEIKFLWNHREPVVDLVLCMIYTGIRPGEALVISEVHDDYFITGSKTEAGLNRVIPLHNDIKEVFHNLYDNRVLNSYASSDNIYQAVKKRFKKLNLEHTPYDCRHTFATLASRYKLDEHCIKLIMGHSIEDLTKRVYTHKLIDELIDEVNKIKIDI